MKLGYGCSLAVILILALASRADAASSTQYSLEEQQVVQQTNGTSVVGGYSAFGYNQYSIVAKIDTLGASLSVAPTLTLPAATADYPTGIIDFPVGAGNSPTWATSSGYNRYQYGDARTTQSGLNASYGTGNYTFSMGATASPTLYLDLTNPTLPTTPLLTSGGTWDNGYLLIDPTAGATLTFNTGDFTTYTSGLGGKINFLLFKMSDYPTTLGSSPQSVYAPEIGKTDAALTSFTIAPGTLTNGETYTLQINYTHIESTNTIPFTGTGISGSPLGMTMDTTTTFITIEAVPEPSASVLLVGGLVGLVGLRWRTARRTK